MGAREFLQLSLKTLICDRNQKVRVKSKRKNKDNKNGTQSARSVQWCTDCSLRDLRLRMTGTRAVKEPLP